MMNCPSCEGRKTALIHYHTVKPPHIWRNDPCKTCQGRGELTDEEMQAHQAKCELHRVRATQRRERNITQRELAKAVETDVGTYSRWESGEENVELKEKVKAHFESLPPMEPDPPQARLCETCRWAKTTNLPSSYYCGFYARQVNHNHTCEKWAR